MGGRGVWRAAFVAIRVLSIYLMVSGLVALGFYSQFLVHGFGDGGWTLLVAAIVEAASGGALWIWATGIADRISHTADVDHPVEEGGENQAGAQLDAATLLWLALLILGLVIAINALSNLIVELGQITTIQFAAGRSSEWFSFAAAGLRLAIGLALVLKGRILVRTSQRTPTARANYE
jgi:hypothetical protein